MSTTKIMSTTRTI